MIHVKQCTKINFLLLVVVLLVHKVASATYFVIPDDYSSHHTDRDRPIMLNFLPIMLCCSAHKIYLLCSKLCSIIKIVLSLLSLFVYKFA